MANKIIGIDLGGTSIKFGILTLEGEVQDKWAIPTNILSDGKHIVPDIIESINHRLNLYNLDKSDFIGIGMGTPGTVDIEAATVRGAFNLNWADVQEVGAPISEGVGLPFILDNDANVAALGERWVGAGENQPDVVFITLGTGVGGGIVAAGNLIHGVVGAAGEIGHIVVEPHDGFACTCGNYGCLETVTSATGVVRLARKFAEEYEGNSEIKANIDNGDEVTSKDIFIAAEAGDAFALSVVDKFAYYLGFACANLGSTLNPAAIVIGGGVSAAGEFLRSKVETYFQKYSFSTVRDSTKIKLAELGNDAGIIGAASLALKFKK
ncbi:ROK family glucokinase [Lactococcus formosensis]|jgi:ROK family protein (putative glucokinase)|uniref:Glucokinase n=1 Tax=Lactococcus formosensis TaxID=1281486 RepID=A0A9Q9D6M9_9LACT|nr:ROK family glucokinase [Lactococcus formosensis]MCH1723804.1 ROK family glucokinase [Lactococcus formosensis]MCO7180783.1 ROK family glucokinase [Lactococcus formosensis]MDG6111830.1 ROK family glucokinase [Lactococcus formosensis]MDG6114144.1 ROK family glucokinase [Lactococcus formosensis]MDG6116175.1 ROK family glucokinase [Lactococcus formosensis]